MKPILKTVFLIASILNTINAHSAGLFLQKINGALPNPPPPAISYHIHVAFNLSDPTSL